MIQLVVHSENSRHQIQIHMICFRLRGFGPSAHGKGHPLVQCHIQLSNEGIMTLRVRNACHILRNHFLRIMHPALQNQPADLWELLLKRRIIAVHCQAVPQRIVIQRNAFHIGFPVNHGSQPSVSQGQGISPHFCGAVIIHVMIMFHLNPPFFASCTDVVFYVTFILRC